MFETINTDEEEMNLYQDEEPMVNDNVNEHSTPHYVSSGTDSDSESFENDFNGNYGDHHGTDEDIDTEYFINQISGEDQNKTTPLYTGSPISVHDDACMHLIRLSHLLNLNKNGMQMLLKEIRLFFPSDCRLPKTIMMLFKMTDNNDRPQVYLRKTIFFKYLYNILIGVCSLCGMW
jgi:hypothetical protein